MMGRHPLAGMSAAFAGVAGGFGAGVFITAADTVLCGVAEQSAHLLDGGVKVLPTVNWTFKIASAPLIALVGWFVADKIVEPRLSRTDWRSVASEEAAAIQTGKFARQWIRENRTGKKKYEKLLKKYGNHRIEKVGLKLRERMPWLGPQR